MMGKDNKPEVYESYKKTDAITGAEYEFILKFQEGIWSVECWQSTATEELCHWDINYTVTGYVDGNPNRQITIPMTEETARAEFGKWRR